MLSPKGEQRRNKKVGQAGLKSAHRANHPVHSYPNGRGSAPALEA